MRRLAAAFDAFIHPERYNKPTPTTKVGVEIFDELHPLEAVLRAWTEEGVDPKWHREKQRQVSEAMPVLARALQRSANEWKERNRERSIDTVHSAISTNTPDRRA